MMTCKWTSDSLAAFRARLQHNETVNFIHYTVTEFDGARNASVFYVEVKST